MDPGYGRSSGTIVLRMVPLEELAKLFPPAPRDRP